MTDADITSMDARRYIHNESIDAHGDPEVVEAELVESEEIEPQDSGDAGIEAGPVDAAEPGSEDDRSTNIETEPVGSAGPGSEDGEPVDAEFDSVEADSEGAAGVKSDAIDLHSGDVDESLQPGDAEAAGTGAAGEEPAGAEPDDAEHTAADADPGVVGVSLTQSYFAAVAQSEFAGAVDAAGENGERAEILLEATQPVEEVRVVSGPVLERVQSLPMAKALNAGLRQAMFDDRRVILMGEDIGALGGVFRVTEGLQAEFGTKRVLDTPLAESGIIGTAIGLAMRGYRPVIEIQFDGFIFPGFDQITSQLAKITNRHEGALQMPVVIRVPYGGHIGAIEHHQESPEAYFAHTPGLRVVCPSTPNDAYWMIQEAIASNDPVMFFEPKSRYWPKGEIDFFESAAPLHSSRVVRTGTDATLVGYGAMISVLLRAAELAAEEGTSLEVVDLRSISPIDYEPIFESVRKTGRLIVAQEAPGFVSVGSEIAATVSEKTFYSLEAPVIRVAGFDAPFPPSKVEELYLPDADRVLEAVDRSLAY